MQKQYLTKDDDRMTVRVDSVIESYEPQILAGEVAGIGTD